jgi:hypothetical protein
MMCAWAWTCPSDTGPQRPKSDRVDRTCQHWTNELAGITRPPGAEGRSDPRPDLHVGRAAPLPDLGSHPRPLDETLVRVLAFSLNRSEVDDPPKLPEGSSRAETPPAWSNVLPPTTAGRPRARARSVLDRRSDLVVDAVGGSTLGLAIGHVAPRRCVVNRPDARARRQSRAARRLIWPRPAPGVDARRPASVVKRRPTPDRLRLVAETRTSWGPRWG